MSVSERRAPYSRAPDLANPEFDKVRWTVKRREVVTTDRSVPMDPELARVREVPIDPETGEALDCTRCGACCESGEGHILILEEDLVLWRRKGRSDLAERTDEGHFGARAFPVTERGACIYLTTPDGQSLCSIYEDRASTCREFQAGSWQCLEFRRDKRRAREEETAKSAIDKGSAVP